MSTCKDCIHEKACKQMLVSAFGYEVSENYKGNAENCDTFKNKADYALVKHGKWVKDRNKRTCSICGFLYLENGKTTFNFCPNCGANMKGGVMI